MLSKDAGELHEAALREKCFHQTHSLSRGTEILPERISVFGINITKNYSLQTISNNSYLSFENSYSAYERRLTMFITQLSISANMKNDI